MENSKMRPLNQITEINPKNLPPLLKGLRTYLGYGLLDVKKIGFYHGLMGNWESGLCTPDKNNWIKITKIVKKSNKSYDELIQLGKTNFGYLIEELANELNMPVQIFLRYIVSRYCHLHSIKSLEKIRQSREDLSKKTKNQILNIANYVNDNKNQDPRRIILNLQKKAIFSNKNGLLLKIFFSDFVQSQKNIFKILNIQYSSGFISNLFHNQTTIPKKVIENLNKYEPKVINQIKEKISSLLIRKSNTYHRKLILLP